MPDYKSIAADVFVASEARSERLASLLREPDDLISLVLRSHLVVEELLFTACAAYCQDVEHLKAAKLRFPQLISLLRAIEKISAVPPRYWDALVELNSLRNALAHRLEPNDLAVRIQRFTSIVGHTPPNPTPEASPSQRELLEASLRYLIGGLEVVAVWHQALEILLAERAVAGTAPNVA